MDILAIKEAFEWFLLRASFASLAGLVTIFILLKSGRLSERIKTYVKRHGWPVVAFFFIWSAWATYTAFPTLEEKQDYQEQQNEQNALNSAWGNALWGNVANVEMLPITNANSQSACAEATSDKLETGNIGTGNIGTGNNGNSQQGNTNCSPFPLPPSLSPEDFARGFVLTHIRVGETRDFSPKDSAIIQDDWLDSGASTVWFYPEKSDWFFSLGTNDVDRVRIHACAQVDPLPTEENVYYAPFKTSLGILPQVNWSMIGKREEGIENGEESNSCSLFPVPSSLFWHEYTPSNTLLLTWQNALYNRVTNTPVSIQMEIEESGSFTYRYDLTKANLWNDTFPTNILVGAFNGALGQIVDISTLTNLTSLFFQRLDPSDSPGSDRDNDGLTIEDELFVYHTNPNLWDSDYDGIGDGDEIASGSNPAQRDSDGDTFVDGSDPNPILFDSLLDLDGDGIADVYENYWFGSTNIHDALDFRDETGFSLLEKIKGGINPTNEATSVAIVSTNSLHSWKLFDGISLDRSNAATNLIWERSFAINKTHCWQQYFLSSSPTNAASWYMTGLELEWETDNGEMGLLASSPFNDSFRLPLSTNNFSSVLTLRLRSKGSTIAHAPKPLYLIAYSPKFIVEGGETITGESGREFSVFLDGTKSSVTLRIDYSLRPCKAPQSIDESDLEGLKLIFEENGDFTYSGDERGGHIVAKRPGVMDLPEISFGLGSASTYGRTRSGGGGASIVVLNPSARYNCNGHGCSYDGVDYDWGYDEYYEEDSYPLNSKCLRRSWGRDWGGSYHDYDCEVSVSTGEGGSSWYVSTEVEGGTGKVYVDGVLVWSDKPLHSYDDTGCGGGGYHEEYLGDECNSCESDCSNGNCDALEGSELGSLKFRIPLGSPVQGQVSGFVWFSYNYPFCVDKNIFNLKEHPSSSITDTSPSYYTRRIVCNDSRGRDVRIAEILNGVRIDIYETASQKLEHSWEITNVNSNDEEIRLRKISRQNNIMSDETYTYIDGDWRRFDNIAGIATDLMIKYNTPSDGDWVKRETRVTRDINDNELMCVTVEQSLIGEFDNAVMRETYREERMWNDLKWTRAEYWNDPSHSARHGQPRLITGNTRGWVYTDYDENGRETLRVEQRGNAAVPHSFPRVHSNNLVNASSLENAFVIVNDYTPHNGDSNHNDDASKVRSESRYVVINGEARLIGRTWKRYTRLTHEGFDAIKMEGTRAHAQDAERTSPTNAYSYEITYADTGEETPLLMRGAIAEALDENGMLTINAHTLSNNVLSCTTRKFFSLSSSLFPLPSYEVTEQDTTYGNTLRCAEYLTENDTLIGNEVSTYDEKNRLRSTTYFDGTYITNSYSCCRLLWRQDREGRKTLRSAKTGEDHLYFAEEDVWLGDVSTNGGYRVTQHFFDALGRETNTVVCVGMVLGEAVESDFNRVEHVERVKRKTEYPYGGSDYAISTDERGKVTISRTDIQWDAMETGESVFTNGVEVIKTKSRTYFGGGSSMRREWDGDKWTEERRFTDYAEDGKRIEYVVTESSDCGVVTNSVSVYDLLGRVIEEQDTIGLTSYTYDGSSSRILEQTRICENIVRVAQFIYDSHGEQVGVLQDGITSRSDITYDVDSSNIAWRLTTERVFGEGTNSCIVTRERLTGLSDECRSQITRSDLSGVWTRITKSFDSTLGVETETTEASSNGTTTLLKKNGLTIESIASSGRAYNEYDSFGRISFVSRTIGNSEAKPYQAFEYTPNGDVASIHTFTNGTDVICESYLHDMLGNKVATTDALGNTIYKSYDPFGNVLAEWGATYPVRYTYDTQNRRTSLATTRDGETWDTTTWSYDAEKGRCLSKTYADGSQVLYTYTPDNLLLRTTYQSGRWTENVYNAKREIFEMLSSDGAHNATMVRDEFGRVVSESNNVASSLYSLHDQFGATNQMDNIDGVSAWFVREFDQNGRLIRFERVGGECVQYVFATNGTLATVSNNAVGAVYSYTDDLLDAGYGFAIQGGTAFSREICRDTYLRDNILTVTNRHGGMIRGVAYSYDELQRPVLRNDDAFGYNSRGEVVFSRGDAKNAEYLYDHIGNLLSDSSVSITNAYTANNLNQYASILRASASPREINFQYDLDGNMTQHDDWIYTYDSACRLTSVSSNNIIVASFAYDAQGRRVKKITATATYRYFYDGLLLSYEHITQHDGSIAEIDYVWGKDISGTHDGACGIGGLLYLKRNGAIYIPFYDAYGNVLGYTDVQGNAVAEYSYNAFGDLTCKSGSMADEFAFRFSTKYYDAESDLYYYTYRYYKPQLMRWLTEDPIAEDGGLNLYGFCGNNPVCRYDKDGRAYFAVRGLDKLPIVKWSSFFTCPFIKIVVDVAADMFNVELVHEHLFFEDDAEPSNRGWGSKKGGSYMENEDPNDYIQRDGGYDDCIMRFAITEVNPSHYQLIWAGKKSKCNCQDYASALRAKYRELENDPEIRCKCKKGKSR